MRGFLYELLSYLLENGKFFEMCDIKACEGKRGMTINLPHELPSITKIIFDCGVKVTVKLTGKQCYRSLLVKDQRFLVRCLFLCLGHVLSFCFREILPVNQRVVFGTEGKSDLGFFPCTYTCFTISGPAEKTSKETR